eukprot:8439977-Heterocapsa_arctica.AAC.1
MPTAFPVPIFQMMFQSSRGSSGLISGRSLTQSYEIIHWNAIPSIGPTFSRLLPQQLGLPE